jgi:hypothetical protein
VYSRAPGLKPIVELPWLFQDSFGPPKTHSASPALFHNWYRSIFTIIEAAFMSHQERFITQVVGRARAPSKGSFVDQSRTKNPIRAG